MAQKTEKEEPAIEEENQKKDEERSIPPTKKYLPKPRKIYIPFVIPWESQAAKETQKGMGAFGTTRAGVTRVDQGQKELKQGELNSETILTLFAEGNNHASQRGMRSFGTHRVNVSRATGEKIHDGHVKESEGIIPRQSGSNQMPSQAGETPIGAHRKQVPSIKYLPEMSAIMDPESETFLSRLNTPNPNNKAGSKVIDIHRRQTPLEELHHAKETEAIMPRLQDKSQCESPAGTGAGLFGLRPPRQVVHKVDDGIAGMLFTEDIVKSKKEVPWATAPRLQSQAGSGGFNKVRDVVNHVKYEF